MHDKHEYINAIARAAFALDHVLDSKFSDDEGTNLRAVAELAINSLHAAVAGLHQAIEAEESASLRH